MPAKKVYPAYLKVIWRFARVFISVFLIQVGTGVAKVDDFEAGRALILSAGAAALVAMGKGVREWAKENKENLYEVALRRIPI